MKDARAWVLIIGVLLILGVSAFLVVQTVRDVVGTVRDTTSDALQPVSDVTGNLATQVARVLHPTPTILPDPVTIVRDVRTLSRLETIQYTLEKIITADRGGGSFEFLFGDKLIFVAHGVVIAGVDLSQLDDQDLSIQGGVLQVQLPGAEIFLTTLDNDKSYVYDRETGLLTKGDINLETAARQAAEDAIEEAALEDGILDQAQQNAEAYLYRLLRNLGYPDVIFVEATPEP
jgi:hypothetical protein